MTDAQHTVTLLTDRFEAEVWKKCLPDAKTGYDCVRMVRENPDLFLCNLKGFAEYQILDVVGEFRVDKGPKTEGAVDLAAKVLEALEDRRSFPLVTGLREWCMFSLSCRLSEMLGKEPPERNIAVKGNLLVTKDESTVSPPKKKKLRLAKGWKSKKRG